MRASQRSTDTCHTVHRRSPFLKNGSCHSGNTGDKGPVGANPLELRLVQDADRLGEIDTAAAADRLSAVHGMLRHQDAAPGW